MPAQLPTHHAQGQSPSPPPWKDPCPQRPTPLVRDLSIAHACCWIPPPTPKTCSGPRWFSGEAGRAGSPRRLSPPVCGCLRPGSQRGRARVRKVSVEGPGEVKAEKPPRPSAALFPPRPAADTKGVGRGGPVATVGLQGQRVHPRRRWHNWKNQGGNLAGGCLRDALTAEGVLQEGVVADGVEGGVEGPVQPAQHGQQQQSGERLQELRYLPQSSGEGWARSPLRRVCPPPLRSAPRPRASPGSSFPRPGWRGRRGR